MPAPIQVTVRGRHDVTMGLRGKIEGRGGSTFYFVQASSVFDGFIWTLVNTQMMQGDVETTSICRRGENV